MLLGAAHCCCPGGGLASCWLLPGPFGGGGDGGGGAFRGCAFFSHNVMKLHVVPCGLFLSVILSTCSWGLRLWEFLFDHFLPSFFSVLRGLLVKFELLG